MSKVSGPSGRPLRTLNAVARQTFRGALRDDLPGEAAKVAFYFVLSLFPLIMSVFALSGIIGGDAVFDAVAAAAQGALPSQAWEIVQELMRGITHHRRPGLLSFGIALTLWAASNGVAALIRGLNVMHGIREGRPWWRRRILSLVVLAAGVLCVVGGAAITIPLVGWFHRIGLGNGWGFAWKAAGFAAFTGTVWAIYYVLPARDPRGVGRGAFVAALIASLLWVIATDLLRVYLANFGRYDKTYGTIGAIIALLLWYYVSVIVVLFGGEVASAIEERRSASHRVRSQSPPAIRRATF